MTRVHEIGWEAPLIERHYGGEPSDDAARGAPSPGAR